MEKRDLIVRIYNNQITHSKERNHEPPNYSLQEFENWMYTQENFKTLWDGWVKSGYKKDLVPSPNRLCDYKPYTFDNLELVTFKENREKGDSDRRNGINNKMSKSVTQFDKQGNKIKTFYSIRQAMRETGANHIEKVCKGKLRTSGGYLWSY